MEYVTFEVIAWGSLLAGLIALVYSIKADWHLVEIKRGIARLLHRDNC